MASHIVAPTNDRLSLCQEYSMRTGDYDDRATLIAEDRRVVTFHSLVQDLGLEQAIRNVVACAWFSRSEIYHWATTQICKECLEIEHA